jgi:predicted  nucleic acid-binding Zn-ribbon protein
MGRICLMNVCVNCKHSFASEDMNQNCEKCGSDNIQRPLLSNVAFHKNFKFKYQDQALKKAFWQNNI